MSNVERETILTALTAITKLRLNGFTGLSPDTNKSHVIEVAGSVYAEGLASSPEHIWMTVHELSPGIRLIAWYELSADALEPEVTLNYPVSWVQRPIVASQVSGLLNQPDSYCPKRAAHLVAWPKRGLCLRYSRRSRHPTLLLAFKGMSRAEFDRTSMARYE